MSMAFPRVRILTAWLTCQVTRLFTQRNGCLEESLGPENTDHGWSIVVLTGRMDVMSRELCWQVLRCLSHDHSSFLSLSLYSLFSETSWLHVWDKSGELQIQPPLSPFIPPEFSEHLLWAKNCGILGVLWWTRQIEAWPHRAYVLKRVGEW